MAFSARLTLLDTLLQPLHNLKLLSVDYISIVCKPSGMFMVTQSAGRDHLCECYLREAVFEAYFVEGGSVEFTIDLKIFRSTLKALNMLDATMGMEMRYPVGDSMFQISQVINRLIDTYQQVQYRLNTHTFDPFQQIENSENHLAKVRFNDPRLIRQAIEIACHGRHDMSIFVSFSTNTEKFLYFTRDDMVTNNKTQVTIPFKETVDKQIRNDAEFQYSILVLRQLVQVQKCQSVEFKLHIEGTLEVVNMISNDVWLKHFISPIVAN